MGEHLYPDTTTAGRDQVRKELRSLRDRWEPIEKSIKDQQKQQEAQTVKKASFQDSVTAARNWLDSMEKITAINFSACNSLQEFRSKLLKLKVCINKLPML